MISTNALRCIVVVAPGQEEEAPRDTTRPNGPRFRPSDLVPWADPHIRSLVEQLQEEVRAEAAAARSKRAAAGASQDTVLN